MIYPKDFPLAYRKNQLFVRRKLQNHINNNNNSGNRLTAKLKNLWFRYCQNTTVHGFKYLAEQDVKWTEKATWILLLILAFIGVVYFSLLIQNKFATSPLSTVVESTIFPVYEIPFPAVTVCNFNRLNARKVNDTFKIFFPEGSNETYETFLKVLHVINVNEFATFDEFNILFNESIAEFENINLLDLYTQLSLNCEDLFARQCWWRNRYINCCELFVKQISEYGVCYAFNSAVNADGRMKKEYEDNYPWRSSSYGDWSGLRFEVKINPKLQLDNEESTPGVIVIIHDPDEWPNSGSFVPMATMTSIILKPIFYYTTSSVKRFAPNERQCIYPDEVDESPEKNLPDMKYLRSNCLSQCRQNYMVKLCNCTVDFFFPIGNYRACNLTDFICLAHHDSMLNNEKPPMGHIYFPNDELGIICNCLPECHRIVYEREVTPIQIADSDKTNITIDIHYQQANMVKYRTDVVFDWLDLIVAFGGIAGLFLGISLLSIAEVVYYLTIGLHAYTAKKESVPVINKNIKGHY